MTETEALKRRDDELTMGDEAEQPLTPTREDDRARNLGSFVVGLASRDELPRDAHGRVIGTWHVHCCSSEVLEERCVTADELEGAPVERALALGCTVLPGARPDGFRIMVWPETIEIHATVNT